MKRLFSVLLFHFCIFFSVVAQDAKALYDEGVKLKEERKTKEAVEKFKQAVQLKPDYIDALYETGWCFNDLKDYAGAIRALRQVVPVWVTIPKCHFELGYAFENTNATDSAIYYYNKCLALNSNYSLAYKQLGVIAYKKEDNSSALDYFIKYESVVKTPINDYLYWYRKGFVQNGTKDYSGAKESLVKSLSFKTDYTNIYLELGFACSRLKDNDQAIEYYKKAIELDPKSHIGYNGIGEVYRDNKKDMAEAMNWYQKTLAINPDERKANFGMGYCLNNGSRFTEAIVYLQKAITAENTYTAAYVELGYSYYRAGKNTDALTNLDKAISLNPKNENAHYYKGLIYISKNDKTNAQRMVDALKALNSRNGATLQEAVNKM